MTLPLVLLLAACATDPVGADQNPDVAAADEQTALAPATPPAPTLAPPPDLPNEAWLQVFDQEGRIVHRLMNDGRYMMQRGDAPAHSLAPLSRLEPGMERVSADARARIEAAMAQVGFFSQPEQIQTAGADLETATPAAYPRRLAISARNPRDNHVHMVLVEADLDEATSFGPLGPMWKALQDDVLGGWKVTANR